jgi:hypothetical protein
MELLINENKKLKEIIRYSDNRIKYLEEKIDNLINDVNINYCYICYNKCDYDEEKCEYNMFCDNYICRDCIIKHKNNPDDKSVCKYNKCNKWYCSSCINACKYKDYLIKCNDCLEYCCLEHYDNSNIDIKNWICKKCNEQLMKSLDYECI